MQNTIKYSGLSSLSEEEQETIKGITEKEYPKIQRMIKNKSDLSVHIRTMKKNTRKSGPHGRDGDDHRTPRYDHGSLLI